jgi:hypothetical protein
MLHSVCNDVEVEPTLQPVTGGNFQRSANINDDARPDVRARGFWRDGQNAYFDVRVTNPECLSQRDKTVRTILKNHEAEKKRQYNQRIMQIEHGTFTPLVFTTTGVMAPECLMFHKALAHKISEKKGERYDDIMRFMRVRLSFLCVKATLLCLRGSRPNNRTVAGDSVGDYSLTLNELRI